MDKLPASFTLNYLEFLSTLDFLESAIKNNSRANIVRCCSNMMYSLSDMLEQAIPDGFTFDVKPLNL